MGQEHLANKRKTNIFTSQAPTNPAGWAQLKVSLSLQKPSCISQTPWNLGSTLSHTSPPSPLVPIMACHLHCAFAFPDWQCFPPSLMDAKALAPLPPPHQWPPRHLRGTNGCLQDGNISGALCYLCMKKGGQWYGRSPGVFFLGFLFVLFRFNFSLEAKQALTRAVSRHLTLRTTEQLEKPAIKEKELLKFHSLQGWYLSQTFIPHFDLKGVYQVLCRRLSHLVPSDTARNRISNRFYECKVIPHGTVRHLSCQEISSIHNISKRATLSNTGSTTREPPALGLWAHSGAQRRESGMQVGAQDLQES